jgi:hypothetical protein
MRLIDSHIGSKDLDNEHQIEIIVRDKNKARTFESYGFLSLEEIKEIARRLSDFVVEETRRRG